MTTIMLVLLTLQTLLGALDNVLHREVTERLPVPWASWHSVRTVHPPLFGAAAQSVRSPKLQLSFPKDPRAPFEPSAKSQPQQRKTPSISAGGCLVIQVFRDQKLR